MTNSNPYTDAYLKDNRELRALLAASQERVRLLEAFAWRNTDPMDMTPEDAKIWRTLPQAITNTDRHKMHGFLREECNCRPTPSAPKPCEACGSTNEKHDAIAHEDFNRTWADISPTPKAGG